MVTDDDGVDWDALYDTIRKSTPEVEDAAGQDGRDASREAEAVPADSDAPFGIGAFSLLCENAPERREGERPATVWGMAWRTGLLLAWYAGVYVVNIWYYLTGHGDYEHSDLAILAWFGIRLHNTWLGAWCGPLTTLAVSLFSIGTPINVGVLMALAGVLHGCKSRLLCLLIASLMPVCAAGAFTEPVLDHADWGADFPDTHPNIVPCLIASVACIALVSGLVFWRVLQDRGSDGTKSRLVRRLAMLSPGVPLLCMLIFGGLPGVAKGVAECGLLMLFAAVFVPSDLDGARWTIEHDRGAYWLWPAALAVVSEFVLAVTIIVAAVYEI